jgi:hypothetical protein
LVAVFQWLAADNWKIKLSKCKFAQRSVAYLGHILSEQGLSTDPAKISAIEQWPIPQSVKDLRGFLGLAGYYRKFIRHFGILAKPLTELLKKDSLFIWTSVHQSAFEVLKAALSSAPVLALPDFSQPFHIETDASGNGVGAVLLQSGHPLAFLSKPLSPRNRGMSAYEKEYLAIVMAVDHWRHYLLQHEFVIHTDHRSLVHLNEQRLHTPWQQKAFTKLLGLRYKIQYRRGAENGVADALSRRQHPVEVLAISSPVHDWLLELQQWYASDAAAQGLLAQLALQPAGSSLFTLRNGVILFKHRIWLGSNKTLQTRVMLALHSSPIGGHSGAPVTLQKIRQLFYWPSMRADILQFVQACVVCTQAKPDRSKYPGLLQPLPVPKASWEVISMDFVEGLPSSGSVNAILVVVDKFSKFAHFVPLRHPFTAESVAKLFLDHIYRLHGLPVAIISDRDRVFTSKFWQTLFRLAGVELRMSSAYHPQTDGQTERVNQCLETFLRCFIHACPRRWSHWLSAAEFWYNSSPHSALGRSPFEVLYGYPPRHLGLDISSATAVPSISDWLHERELMHSLIHQHLLRAQQRMKKQADKGRLDRTFQVGDAVFLKLQPYVQSSIARRSSQKLAFRFFGPFRVLERIGNVAYRLDLPASSSVHPVFHVSQLKRSPGSASAVAALPSALTEFQVPIAVLQKRWTGGSHPVEQGLVRWSHMPPALSTWESLEALQQQFPRPPAWGHAVPQEEGNVSNTRDTPLDSSAQKEAASALRPKRTAKPNLKLSGPEWSK